VLREVKNKVMGKIEIKAKGQPKVTLTYLILKKLRKYLYAMALSNFTETV
jgi:hypothetical protein